tara:strand:- start:302 stop:460 length:159 start_codon:yes stop_codon:yes gene_type:complete
MSACATTVNFEKDLNSWTGHNVNEFIDSWGYPVNPFKAPVGFHFCPKNGGLI